MDRVRYLAQSAVSFTRWSRTGPTKAEYPRTAAEFAEDGRLVIRSARLVGIGPPSNPRLITFTFGEDFDLYDGFSELRSRLNCGRRGEPRPSIRFRDPNEKRFEPVSYEEALTRSLEFRALARARDAGEPPHPYGGRVRKLGYR